MNDKKWAGLAYDDLNKSTYELKNGKGYIKNHILKVGIKMAKKMVKEKNYIMIEYY